MINFVHLAHWLARVVCAWLDAGCGDGGKSLDHPGVSWGGDEERGDLDGSWADLGGTRNGSRSPGEMRPKLGSDGDGDPWVKMYAPDGVEATANWAWNARLASLLVRTRELGAVATCCVADP